MKLSSIDLQWNLCRIIRVHSNNERHFVHKVSYDLFMPLIKTIVNDFELKVMHFSQFEALKFRYFFKDKVSERGKL